jgi:hypothetical protein
VILGVEEWPNTSKRRMSFTASKCSNNVIYIAGLINQKPVRLLIFVYFLLL